MSDDPFAVLGVPNTATPAEIAAARRRLARAIHPDHGGDLSVMQRLNAAHDEALRRRVTVPVVAPAPRAPARPGRRARVQQDAPSFLVHAPPARTHEALLLVASWVGETVNVAGDVQSVSVIECVLDEPARCWCRLDVMPEGEASAVSLTVEQYDDVAPPDIDAVRDVWVANLNQLEQL